MTVAEYAEASLCALVKHVFASGEKLEFISYSELARRIGRIKKDKQGNGRGMGEILDKMADNLMELDDSIPLIHSLVGYKDGPSEGLPGNGFKKFWPNYQNLSVAGKKTKVENEYRKIKEYGDKWNDVLTEFGISLSNY